MKENSNVLPTGLVDVPKITGVGDLTVENKNNETTEESKPKHIRTDIGAKTPKLDLPEVGTIFNIGEKTYEVNYVNYGQGRFSSMPCK